MKKRLSQKIKKKTPYFLIEFSLEFSCVELCRGKKKMKLGYPGQQSSLIPLTRVRNLGGKSLIPWKIQ